MEKILTLPLAEYYCLLGRVTRASDAHIALLKAGDPESFDDKSAPRVQFYVACNLETAGTLLQIAVEHCPDAVESLKKCIDELHRKP
jgi:hypothetical protein